MDAKYIPYVRCKSLLTVTGFRANDTETQFARLFKADTKANIGDMRFSVYLKPTIGT